MKLVGKKPLNQVTVKEITEDADVNRSTFYFHYQDVGSMVVEMEDKFLQDFSVALTALEQKSHDFIAILVRCLENHRDLCKLLLGSNGDMAFVEKMKAIVAEKCSKIWKDAVPELTDVEASAMDTFLIGGVMSTLQTWILSERRVPAKEITDILNRLIFDGICPVIATWQLQENI